MLGRSVAGPIDFEAAASDGVLAEKADDKWVDCRATWEPAAEDATETSRHIERQDQDQHFLSYGLNGCTTFFSCSNRVKIFIGYTGVYLLPHRGS